MASEYSKNNNKSDFRNKMDENENYNFKNNKICTSEYVEEINAIIITVNIERAVADNVMPFRNNMKAYLGSNHNKYIIDLSEALFMDSSFLGALILILKQITAKGGSLTLVINEDKIKILSPFEQLKKILNVYPNLKEALDFLKET